MGAADENAVTPDPRRLGDVGKDAVDVVQQQGPEIDRDEQDARAVRFQSERVGLQVVADVLDGVVVMDTLYLAAELVVDDLPGRSCTYHALLLCRLVFSLTESTVPAQSRDY